MKDYKEYWKKYKWIVMIVAVLQYLDWAITFYGISIYGISLEGNPFGRWLFSIHPLMALLFKMFFIGLFFMVSANWLIGPLKKDWLFRMFPKLYDWLDKHRTGVVNTLSTFIIILYTAVFFWNLKVLLQ